jgi:hypothetical protein
VGEEGGSGTEFQPSTGLVAVPLAGGVVEAGQGADLVRAPRGTLIVSRARPVQRGVDMRVLIRDVGPPASLSWKLAGSGAAARPRRHRRR